MCPRNSKPFYTRNPLTHLPTREAFDVAIRDSEYIALFIDLDNLKEINRYNGYHAGDLAIINVANSILRHVRKTDLVSHWGGDEFAVLLYAITTSEAKLIADRILAYTNELGYEVSIGIGSSIETAQACQQIAKSTGKNQVSNFGHSRLTYRDQNQSQIQNVSYSF